MDVKPIAFAMVICALLMFGLAVYLHVHSRNARFREKVSFHFERALPHSATISGTAPGTRETQWHRFMAKASIYAGFELKPQHLAAMALLLFLVGLLGGLWLGVPGIFLLPAAAIFVFGFLVPYTRLRRRQALITSQVPMFVDQVIRSMSTGRSVESAIRLAAEESATPLKYVLERVVRATDLGADLAHTLNEAALLHGLRELSLVSLALNISNTYGSSPREMLQSVVQMIRHQELAQRELAAMTGETRVSAWVLGLTPLALAGYMIITNPGYLDMMLQDSSGKAVLYIAASLQAAGVLLLWRMLRSI
jgi:tight adherence protein B